MKPQAIIYLLFSFFVLLISWEDQGNQAIAAFHHEVSQEDAIRLRILANSDSISDQKLKREIRDKVNQSITEWVTGIESKQDAMDVISSKLHEIEAIVESELENRGINQLFEVDFEQVDFPTKLYGNLVYPAGEYQAVLITLGEGKGENWWCVLFPPLCFIDMEQSEAVPAEEVEADIQPEKEVEVSFFFVDFFKGLFETIFGGETTTLAEENQ
ncbi:stage II sporulation protein R [Alkalicoccobacillus murimartini]|uniref:Stage II sporulation protein R n=1 Tax=Alkalicoccobacillus murimartini TaxID=171685 RepID=A0ABT9YGR1_9BACI|nr:stage II sporulation protein R [Alkalicoccobacillus murimartini]MDQ0207053.1 stage II sporulation protein R [Alkalicoccobacillus murimartini]